MWLVGSRVLVALPRAASPKVGTTKDTLLALLVVDVADVEGRWSFLRARKTSPFGKNDGWLGRCLVHRPALARQ